jgi:putative transposase
MARPLRIERSGGWYHVISRGNERKPIFRDDRDRRHFLELLGKLVGLYRIRLHVFVLMDNHYHLVLELTEANLSRAVQWLNVSYSVWFNRRRQRSGHLFQGRFKSVVVEPEVWALALSRYLHLNPVRVEAMGLGKRQRGAQRVGLVAAPSKVVVHQRMQRLRGYPWSSYRAYAGETSVPEWLECDKVLGLGGGVKAEQRQRYRKYVEDAVREGLPQTPWESVKEQAVLGGAEFLAALKKGLRFDLQEQRRGRRLLAERPSLAAVIQAVEALKDEKWDQFRDRHADRGRDLVLYLGRKLCGLKLAELAEAVELRNYAVVGTSVQRYERSLASIPAEKANLKKVLQMLNCEI